MSDATNALYASSRRHGYADDSDTGFSKSAARTWALAIIAG